jgi:hypothetical protein
VIQDAAGFLSGAFMVPTNIAALVKSVSYLGLEGLLRRTYLFDLAQDITKMAAIVMLNLPGVAPIYPAVTATVGCLVSLGRFVKKNYFTDEVRDRANLEAPEGIDLDLLIPPEIAVGGREGAPARE